MTPRNNDSCRHIWNRTEVFFGGFQRARSCGSQFLIVIAVRLSLGFPVICFDAGLSVVSCRRYCILHSLVTAERIAWKDYKDNRACFTLMQRSVIIKSNFSCRFLCCTVHDKSDPKAMTNWFGCKLLVHRENRFLHEIWSTDVVFLITSFRSGIEEIL